ncbi:hypothetical protein B0H66DRAFT_593101 [Apodospora peruviana]|uniref:Uncharacterized protein n=1 Tax=Apodospora peruviana TaxID=516989 RepID=A0AAE0I3P0_9PEZI|nr:hypothetical protein B0H66DRAFT_593101 [Apodospora peruviana]
MLTTRCGDQHIYAEGSASIHLPILALVSVLVTIGKLSKRPGGLAYADGGLSYLWTLGLTTVLTVLVGFWSRVKFQAKRYLPWMIIAKDDSSEHDIQEALSQDYFSLLSVSAIYPALRNRYFIVALPIAVSLLIGVMVALSTSLVGLEHAHLWDPITITIEHSFETPSALALKNGYGPALMALISPMTLFPSSITTTYTTTTTGETLVNHSIPRASEKISIAMIAISSTIVLASIALLFVVPGRGVWLHPTDTIIDDVLLLRKYGDVMRQFRGAGLESLFQLGRRVKDQPHADDAAVSELETTELQTTDHSTARPSKVPEVSRMAALATAEERPALESHQVRKAEEGPTKWYDNWTLLLSTQIAGFGILAGLIGAIAGLFAWSKANDGLLYVSEDPKLRLFWTTFPVAVVTGISLYCDSFFFAVRVLAPFRCLRQGPRLGHPQSMHHTHNHLDAIKTVFVTAIISLLSATLSIPTSHLFTLTEGDEAASQILLQQQTSFAPRRGYPDDFPMSNKLLHWLDQTLFQHNLNQSYFTWTYEGLAFPEFTPLDDHILPPWQGEEEPERAARIRSRIPALRAQLDCSFQSSTSNTNISHPVNDTLDALLQSALGTTCSRIFPKSPILRRQIHLGDSLPIALLTTSAIPCNSNSVTGRGTLSTGGAEADKVNTGPRMMPPFGATNAGKPSSPMSSFTPQHPCDWTSIHHLYRLSWTNPQPSRTPTRRRREPIPSTTSRVVLIMSVSSHRLGMKFRGVDTGNETRTNDVIGAIEEMHSYLGAQSVHVGSTFRRTPFSSSHDGGI